MNWMFSNNISQTEMNLFMRWVHKWQSFNSLYRCADHKTAFDIIEEPCWLCLEDFNTFYGRNMHAPINKTKNTTEHPAFIKHQGELSNMDSEGGELPKVFEPGDPGVSGDPEVRTPSKAPRNRGPRSKE